MPVHKEIPRNRVVQWRRYCSRMRIAEFEGCLGNREFCKQQATEIHPSMPASIVRHFLNEHYGKWHYQCNHISVPSFPVNSSSFYYSAVRGLLLPLIHHAGTADMVYRIILKNTLHRWKRNTCLQMPSPLTRFNGAPACSGKQLT